MLLKQVKVWKGFLFMPLNINERALKINIGKQYLETCIHKKNIFEEKISKWYLRQHEVWNQQ